MKKLIILSSLVLLAGAGCSQASLEPKNDRTSEPTENTADKQEGATEEKSDEPKNETAVTTTDSENEKTESGMNVEAEIKANIETKTSNEEKPEEIKEPAQASSKSDAGAKTEVETTPAASSDKTTNSGQEATQSTKEFSITAKKWEFVPSTITVNKGDKVRLVVQSLDVDHGFAISEFGIKRTLKPGQSETVEFMADASGSFSFFCSVSCGSGHSSMKGTLIVN
ncbi:MAG: cupredoxin domain-containing protein [Candidatus Magasanikbacteria bacterium]|nr:cupredoxin domain-containing protein [Candidatus Magasanikbacteria bacterium]